MKFILILSLSCLILASGLDAKKHHEENVDENGAESREHSVKKYGKDQKVHHHSSKHHSHKKHKVEEIPEVVEEPSLPKSAPVDVPESEAQLQSDITTNKKEVKNGQRKEQTEDLHLQDLAFEESLKKEQKKKNHKKAHHGAHHASTVKKSDSKFFSEHEAEAPVKEKVLEDSFETLESKPVVAGKEGKKNKSGNKNNKNKKAYEKSKGKNHKGKDQKKNKDKKQQKKQKW